LLPPGLRLLKNRLTTVHALEAHGLIAVCIDDKCSLFRGFFFSFTFFCGFSPRLLKEFPEGLTLFSLFCLRYPNLLLISRSREQAKVSFSDGTN
jgi:hypothetical protein